MTPHPNMKLSQERGLLMTFALRQALEILQMPQLELAQWLKNEIERNPLLELNESYHAPRSHDEVVSELTLYEHLTSQIRENFSESCDLLIAGAFLENLDERGILTSSSETIALELKVPETDVKKVLSTLQSFDPPGIFAHSVQEALLLQLRLKGKQETEAFQIVEKCFDHLLHERYKLIQKELKITDLSKALKTLSRLTLRPAEIFKKELSTPAIADLKIEKFDGGWTLELTEDELPKFHIKEEYLHLEIKSDEENESYREFKTQAKWIFRSLERRRKLIREIGRILIRKQAPYLSNKGPLNPLSMKDLADKLQVHESTLSRALSGKYAMTPRGTIPLRSLITSSPETETAKAILDKLVQSEDKKNPLSDDQLAKELQSKGFLVARRTISKYRTQLKIPSAVRRRYSSKVS